MKTTTATTMEATMTTTTKISYFDRKIGNFKMKRLMARLNEERAMRTQALAELMEERKGVNLITE
ncbi:MAG: hypothetical protein J6V00_02230 [Bacteroidaceae bacterium]|nr:hypothetical protein [Bacteroidaceae bacterium]